MSVTGWPKQIKTQLAHRGQEQRIEGHLSRPDIQLSGISSQPKGRGGSAGHIFSRGNICDGLKKQQLRRLTRPKNGRESYRPDNRIIYGLQFAGQSISGVGHKTEFAGALTRLSRSRLDAANEGRIAGRRICHSWEFVLDAEGNLRSCRHVLSDLADTFQIWPNGVEKTAAAVEASGPDPAPGLSRY